MSIIPSLGALLCLVAAAAAAEGSPVVIEADGAPAASIADGVLRQKRINFVYSNSRLGIGTNRPPKIEIVVTRSAKGTSKANQPDPSPSSSTKESTNEGTAAGNTGAGKQKQGAATAAGGDDASGYGPGVDTMEDPGAAEG
jgi:hypothetical protein